MTKQSANGVHRETLAFMKSEGRLEGTALALNVEQKVRQGHELDEVEAGVLNLGITKEQLRFIHQNGL